MNAREISTLLNDGEINKIADLFLAACGFNTAAQGYRLVRNTVLLLPYCEDGEVYYMLSALVEQDPEVVCERVENAVRAIGDIRKNFNARFKDDLFSFDNARKSLEMPETETITEQLAYLSAVLSYIIRTNYHLQ